MNKGKLEDFGSAYELICKKTGTFYDLLSSLEKSEREKLTAFAKINWLKRKKEESNFIWSTLTL